MPETLTEEKFARTRCRDVPAEHLDKSREWDVSLSATKQKQRCQRERG